MTSDLPWFMDLTFQVPMQYCSLQHQTLLLSPVTSTTGCCFYFGSLLPNSDLSWRKWRKPPDHSDRIEIPYDYIVKMRNRFKGLDCIDRVPEELWTVFMTLYRRQGSRPSQRKRNAKIPKWLSEEALQIVVKRREVKSKGEKERYTHLNAEFQRKAKRYKKAFLSDQCKDIE